MLIPEYNIICIKRLKRNNSKVYLNFLIHNNEALKDYYKFAIKHSRKLYVYIDNITQEIIGIIGISDTVQLVKWVASPQRLFLEVYLMYVKSIEYIHSIIDSLTSYAFRNRQCRIIFNHITSNDIVNVLINNEYEVYNNYTFDCEFCRLKEYTNMCNIYYKDISDWNTARIVYCKEYDPNKDYILSCKEYYEDNNIVSVQTVDELDELSEYGGDIFNNDAIFLF